MRKIIYIISLLFLSNLITSLNAQEVAKKGFANIDTVNNQNNVIKLNGTWEFYDSCLYSPEDFIQKKTKKTEYLSVPGLWSKIKKNKNADGAGFGTYRLILTHTKKGVLYAVNLNKVQSAYKIWVNNDFLKEEGKVGTSKETSESKWSSSDVIFKAESDTTQIILQISNFRHKKGGIENAIIFGKAETLTEYGWNRLVWNILLLGILLIMAAYHFASYLFRRYDKSNLYFSLTLISSAIFSSTIGEILLNDLFPALNWSILVKTNYISNYLRLLFFTLFIYHAFRNEVNKLFIKIFTIISLTMILFVAVTPVIIFTNTLMIFIVLTGITLLYIVISLVRAMIRKRPGAIFSFIGVIFLLGTAVNDILKELQIIDSVSLTIYGVFIFIILHSYLITLQNAFSYKTIKRITENIKIRSSIKDALFSADSYNLTAPLEAVSKVIDADRALIFVYSDNDWTATNEYLKKEGTSKQTKIKVLSGKENTYFSSFNLSKSIASKKPTFTIVNEAVKARDMKYLEGSGIHSLMSYPLIKDGIVRAILYFENYEEKKDFEKFTLNILDDIKPQILVFIDNLTTYNNLKELNFNLEKEVRYKTREIETRTEELKLVRSNLEKQNLEIFEQTQKLEKQNEQINDGINYSKKIQKALLRAKENLQSYFPDAFLFHKAAGSLTGTFYRLYETEDGNIVYTSFSASGSDVSRALVSILMTQLLNEIVLYERQSSPKIILNKIQEKFETYQNTIDPIRIAVIYFDRKKQEVLFSGAAHTLFYSYEDHLIEYKSNENPLQFNTKSKKNKKRFFSNKKISVTKNTELFICSGDLDCNNKKDESSVLQKKEILKVLLSINEFNEAETKLNDYFKEIKKDILITGIKF